MPKASQPKKSGRIIRSFPACAFEEALHLGTAIYKYASGPKIRRLTLFENLQKSPDSSGSRQLIVNSNRYEITTGSAVAEYLELTTDGLIVANPESSEFERVKVSYELAIAKIAPFKALYDQFRGNKLPSTTVMRDTLIERGLKDPEIPECIEAFIVNLKYLGLLRTVAGAERIIPIEQVLEEISARGGGRGGVTAGVAITTDSSKKETEPSFEKTCFYITPIGEEGSEERKHSDLFLGSIVEPALDELGFAVIRADKIGKPGMISSQIIQHILRARLVVADLSFHNPNVFYELCLRHACRLPTVQIIRSSDRIPFDLQQFSTIKIDNGDIYSLVPKLQTYKAEIALQARRALDNPEAGDNPITAFCPSLKVSF